MHGIAVEYDTAQGGAADPAARATCRAHLADQPGYRRQLALQADGWRRLVDLFLYDGPRAADEALAGDGWRAVVAAHSACRAAPAVVDHESPRDDRVVLRRPPPGSAHGDQSCCLDSFAYAEPDAILW